MWPFSKKSGDLTPEETAVRMVILAYRELAIKEAEMKAAPIDEDYDFDPHLCVRSLHARKHAEAELWKLKQNVAMTQKLWCELWSTAMAESDFDINRAAEQFAALRRLDRDLFETTLIGWQWCFLRYFGIQQKEGAPLVPVDIPHHPKNFLALINSR